MRFRNVSLILAVSAASIWVASCAVQSAPKSAALAKPNLVVVSSKVFELGAPLSPEKAAALNDFKIVTPLAGREAHNLLTDFSDTTKPSFLILNEIGASGVLSTQAFPILKPTSSNSRTNEDMASYEITDPQFSPDGRQVLFKFGFAGAPASYRLYIFDTQTHTLKLIPSQNLQYYAVSWSPDGEYIAFAEGTQNGRFYDWGRSYEGVLKLYLYQRRTGKIQHVISSRTLRGPWTWKAPHNLIYGSLTPQDEKVFRNPNRETGTTSNGGKPVMWEKIPGRPKRKPVVPNAYEYSPDSKQTTLLQRDAYMPVASPDGKRLAFLGSSDVKHPSALSDALINETSSHAIVTGYGETHAKRLTLDQHNGLYPDLMWRNDNQHLLVMQRTAPPPEARYEIREWDVTQKESRLVTTLEEHDPDEARSDNDPIFRPLYLSADGQSLFLDVREYYSLGENRGDGTNDVLERIDLTNGAVTTIGHVKDTTETDWHETTSTQTKTP